MFFVVVVLFFVDVLIGIKDLQFSESSVQMQLIV